MKEEKASNVNGISREGSVKDPFNESNNDRQTIQIRQGDPPPCRLNVGEGG